MNSSYKFALLGAVGLMVIVIGVVAIKSSGNKPNENDDQLPDPTPPSQLADNTPRDNPTEDPTESAQAPVRPENDRTELDRGTPVTPPVDPPEQDTTTEVDLGPISPDSTQTPTNPRGLSDTTPDSTDPAEPNTTPEESPDEPVINPPVVDVAIDPGEPDEPAIDPRDPAPTRGGDRGGVPLTHTVEPGDVLWDIAERYYGDGSKWFEIAQANPTVDPTRLALGEVLRLPALEAANQPREEPDPPRPGEHSTYTVKPGQTLSHVAQEVYGNANAWRVIYHRNRDLIGASPDRLQAGMELVIPPRVED